MLTVLWEEPVVRKGEAMMGDHRKEFFDDGLLRGFVVGDDCQGGKFDNEWR